MSLDPACCIAVHATREDQEAAKSLISSLIRLDRSAAAEPHPILTETSPSTSGQASASVIPWSIDNKYYTAEVNFVFVELTRGDEEEKEEEDGSHSSTSFQDTANGPDNLRRGRVDDGESNRATAAAPAHIVISTELSFDKERTSIASLFRRLSQKDPSPEYLFRAIIPCKGTAKLVGNESLKVAEPVEASRAEWEDKLMEFGAVLVDLTDEGLESGLQDLSESLQTIMWPSMVRKAASSRLTRPTNGGHELQDEQKQSLSGASSGDSSQRPSAMDSQVSNASRGRKLETIALRKRIDEDLGTTAHTDNDRDNFGSGAGAGGVDDFGDFVSSTRSEKNLGGWTFGEQDHQDLEAWLNDDEMQRPRTGARQVPNSAGNTGPFDASERGEDSRGHAGFEDDFIASDSAGGEDARDAAMRDIGPLIAHMQSVRQQLAGLEHEDERRRRAAKEVQGLFQKLGMADEMGLDFLDDDDNDDDDDDEFDHSVIETRDEKRPIENK